MCRAEALRPGFLDRCSVKKRRLSWSLSMIDSQIKKALKIGTDEESKKAGTESLAELEKVLGTASTVFSALQLEPKSVLLV